MEMAIAAESDSSPIDVLFGANGLSDGSFTVGTDMRAERKLDEDSADGWIVVKPLDYGDDLLYSRGLWKSDVVEVDPNLLGGLCFHTDIEGGIWTGSGLDYS